MNSSLPVLCKTHFDPKPLVIAQRFHFYRRERGLIEFVLDYVVELRKLAPLCEFGNFLEEALHDRVVCGIHNMAAQKHLLSKKNLHRSGEWCK